MKRISLVLVVLAGLSVVGFSVGHPPRQQAGTHQTGQFLNASAAARPPLSPAAGLASLPSSEGRKRGRAGQSPASLPLAAQASISAALGRDIAGYHIRPRKDGFRTANAQHKLAAEFTSAGVTVRSGSASESFGLALLAYGYGNDLESAQQVLPIASANRVEYKRGALTEWYVNGPLGLEQGFTLAAPPSRAHGQPAGQPLQIALALSGDFSATVDQGQRSVTLAAPNQPAAMQYAGLTATDATGTDLPAWLELREGSTRGEQLLIEVADATARYPITIDPLFQAAKLTASGGAAFAELGMSVSISGNTVVAGAPGFGSNQGRGTVYVFIKPASGWANMTQTAKLTASDGMGCDALGYSVSVSGNTVIAGAPFAKIGSNSVQGAAYVFVKPASGWTNMTQTAKLTASDGAAQDEFGWSVSISGNKAVAGARSARIGSNSLQGAAYVFVKGANDWANMTQTAKLTASDGAVNDQLGWSLSLSGNTVVAGVPNAAIGPNDFQGAVYVFVKPASGWANMTQTAKLTAADGAANDELGFSVSVSGNTVGAGARNLNQSQGAAYVFVKPASGWVDMTQTAELMASDAAAFAELGYSVSTNGSAVVAGAFQAKIGSNGFQGAAYLFVKPARGWENMTQTAKMTASDGDANDQLGFSVSVSGDAVVAGARCANIRSHNQQGAAYVFEPESPPPQLPR